MSLSKDYTLDLTLNDLIEDAYDHMQVGADGETLTGDMLTRARSSLNLMIKAWEGQGIHLWTYKEGTLFLVEGQAKYDFATARLANEPIRTTTTAAEDAVITPTVVSCTSVTGMSAGMNFGVLKDDNTIFWSSIASIATLTVTMNDSIDGATASGTTIWAYPGGNPVVITSAADDSALTFVVNGTDIEGNLVTESILGGNVAAVTTSQKYLTVTQIRTIGNMGSVQVGIASDLDGIATTQNPAASADLTLDGAFAAAGIATLPGGNAFVPVSRIKHVRRQDSASYEVPIVFKSREDYMDLPDKLSEGTPIQAYYSRQEPDGVMYLWNAPSSEAPVINFTYERKLNIMTVAGDFYDFPDYWGEAISFNLAKRLITKFGTPPALAAEIKLMAQESLDIALSYDQEIYPIKMDMRQYG